MHDLSLSNSNEESCSFSGDDRNFNGHSHISAGDAANGTSLHAFNGLPTYLPTYLRTYISLILIAPRPASIASICITRTYIYIYTYVYIPIDRFVSSLCLVPTRVPSRLSVLFRAPPVAHRQACSLSLSREKTESALSSSLLPQRSKPLATRDFFAPLDHTFASPLFSFLLIFRHFFPPLLLSSLSERFSFPFFPPKAILL